jgi:monoamine oxidase
MRLAAARVSFAVFEARGRVGGRAYTIADEPFPLDLGCGWLHSADRNPWTRIAAAAGFIVDRTLPAWGTQSFDLEFSAEDQDAFALASRRFHDRFEAIGPNDADCSAAELLEPDCRFNPLLNAVSSPFLQTGRKWPFGPPPPRRSGRDCRRSSNRAVGCRSRASPTVRSGGG